MKNRRLIPYILVGCVVSVLAAFLVFYAGGRSPASSQLVGQFNDSFQTPPKAMLVDGEILFSRLTIAQMSEVRITPKYAARVASAQYGRGNHARIDFESLGGYVDVNRIVHDWVGTKSWIPKAVPAYIVRISGVEIDSLGPRGGIAPNHSWNVVVNATNGKIVSAFTYN